jgi:putative redox protein
MKFCCRVTHRHSTSPDPDKGGAGAGFGPHELIEAALATCMTITVRKQAEKDGIPLAAGRCEVRLDRSDPIEPVFRHALIFDGPLSVEQETQLRQAAAMCPVARTLVGGIAAAPANGYGEGQG